jgi:hypothetical protein
LFGYGSNLLDALAVNPYPFELDRKYTAPVPLWNMMLVPGRLNRYCYQRIVLFLNIFAPPVIDGLAESCLLRVNFFVIILVVGKYYIWC